MSDQSVELDLKFLPDWLKEAPATNRYADFEGEPERRRDDRGRGDRRGPRPGGPGGPRPGGGGPRPGGPRPGGAPYGDRGPQQRDQRGPGGYKDRRGPGGGGGGGNFRDRDRRGPAPEYVPQQPRETVVKAEMLPEPAAASGISKQIKTSGRACSVFRVAKMFLERPERYRVRVTSLDPNGVLYQIGDGPVSQDRAVVERGAFRSNMEKFYVVETIQGDAPKGNYTSVARHRFSGVLLGPPNHHSYQTASRKLYEERFSRRMSFVDFQREIEMVSDPAAIEQWKQQASSSTVYKTRVEEGQEPQVFRSPAEAEQHFRTTHLPQLMKSAHSLEMSGHAANVPVDRNIHHTVRDLVERERRVPVGLVNALRPYFSEAGLHLFKWKRKILFASAIRPQRHPANQTFGEGISAILSTVGERPGIKRPELAHKVLGELAADDPTATEKKEALARDLHYLVHIGYVVEFQNGTLELPPPKKEQAQASHEDHRMDVSAEMAELHEQPAKPESGRSEAPRGRQAEQASSPQTEGVNQRNDGPSQETPEAATQSAAETSGTVADEASAIPDPGYTLVPLLVSVSAGAI